MSSNKSRREFLKAGALASSAFLLPGTLSALSRTSERYVNEFLVKEFTENLTESLGLLDVTKAPYFADPTGINDSTLAIQEAVNDARNKGLVCFFPGGTYTISDTISCEQRVEKQEVPRYLEHTRMSYWYIREPMFLLGSAKGPRPVIKLAAGAKGFNDPQRPKLMMKIWAQTWGDYPGQNEPIWGKEQPNISFSHVLKGIDFDLNGNSGAIGLRHTGSQGSYLMDSKVIATGGYAGFNNCPGQGGGTYNLEVVGGQYGIIADPDCRFPMLASCVFKNQTVAPVSYESTALPMVLVGCTLISDGPSAVDLTKTQRFTGISLIDCVIQMNKPGAIFNQSAEQNVFLENVFVKGAATVTNGGTPLPKPSKWTEIKRLTTCNSRSENLINGKITTQTFLDWATVSKAPAGEEFRIKHWRRLPSFEDADVINIKTLGARGDGETDDTAALKKALQTHKKIFFPAGRYKITEDIQLGPDVELFSIRNASIEAPSITTVDSANDSTLLSFISINGTLNWRCGKGVQAFAGGRMKISGNGGGRFYALRGIGGRGGESLIEGNTQPIFLYTLNIERRPTNPQGSIKNAKHVRIYYFKCEASEIGYGANLAAGEGTGNTPLAIIDSEDIRVYCVNGNVVTSYQRPMVDVVNCRNILISQAASFNTGNFPQIRETFGNEVAEVPSTKVAALFLRD
jgi:hypothetical protein